MLAPATLWIDPGKMTGLAFLTSYDGPPEFWATEHDFFVTCLTTERICEKWGRKLAIGWERFTITGQTHKKTPQPDAMHVIGVCRWLAMKNGCRVLPEAQQATPSALERKQLQAIGWWPAAEDDAQSAAAHMLRYLVKEHEVPPMEAEILARLSGR